ncbi:NPCBM-associated, NEW3 domain of alpha-galactosidase [Enhydrobacter aerosaccus]|uniref:NPCBM-associated, NEW3 domain of alpha-galactosidase n=1 Tax=Enhydrobacter aerosaccus TaxID=225324 RepID=A0A1T4KSW0_9HYPH|nr:NEW3 domain-containing protein [Enhydrobacter aerosaccus]SJZ45534.1 NPCBM-associated, NEW3 domain of alpha-galactosidase [Enhydrobacter aerosaccus]
MRRLIASLALVATSALTIAPVLAANPPPSTAAATTSTTPQTAKGLWLLTDYPSQTVRAGETTSIHFKLQNMGLPPEPLALSVSDVPAGWKIDVMGSGQPVAAAMPAMNESVSLQLRVDVPKEAKPGSHTVTVHAKGPNQSIDLPVTLTIGEIAPAKLTIKSTLPALRGTPKSSFDYNLSVTNDSGKDLTVALSAQAPANFQTTFTEGYGTNEISSIPIPAGQSKDIKIKVTPPREVKAGDYPVLVKASAEGATADQRVTLQISGQGKLSLTTKDGRLSGDATVGKNSEYTLLVGNDGTAPLEDVEMSGSVPTNWKVEFNPKTIQSIAPGDKKEVQAVVTPAEKAIAGDYVASFRAGARGDSANADFRITVTTSTLWGIVGVGIIAVALLVLLGAVARFGRR